MRYLVAILPYATLLTVAVGVLFGTIQAAQVRQARALSAALELVHTIRTPEFTDAIRVVLSLPANAPPEDVLSRPRVLACAYSVSHSFESLGVLVFYHLLPLHFVDYLLGGYARESWSRLRPFTEHERERLGPMFGEWYQWLVERMNETPAPGKSVGAPFAELRWPRIHPVSRLLRV